MGGSWLVVIVGDQRDGEHRHCTGGWSSPVDSGGGEEVSA